LAANATPINDLETRQRLLGAAARLFAERGYQHVTVRDICKEAGANVAAVNYYFRDKEGLYQEVIQLIIRHIKETFQVAHNAGQDKTPDDRLRHYVRVFLRSILKEGQDCWQGKLIAREMTDPTHGFDLLVDQVIRPNSAKVAALVSDIMGQPISDPRVGICVGSIQTQIVGMANPVAVRMIPGGRFTPEIIDFIADHISNFSLGGIRAVADSVPKVKA